MGKEEIWKYVTKGQAGQGMKEVEMFVDYRRGESILVSSVDWIGL